MAKRIADFIGQVFLGFITMYLVFILIHKFVELIGS